MTMLFDTDGLDRETLTRRMAELWADLPFDDEALASLRRDGVKLDGLHLGGASPYSFLATDDDRMTLMVDGEQADERLLDLWQIYFARRLGVTPAPSPAELV